jgi:outer membrane protein assembly factor BamD
MPAAEPEAGMISLLKSLKTPFSVPFSRMIACAVLVGVMSGCAGDDKGIYVDRSVEDLYNSAIDRMQSEEWKRAGDAFDEVERQHPYSVWARRAILMNAYVHYQDRSYDDAILAAQRFIQLHPGNRDVGYAYYLVGICYYEQISDVGRDQKTTENALKALDEVVKRFPGSDYGRDARLKLDLARDHLAGKEMEIGRYYLTRGYYAAAIARFKTVVDKYQTTTHVPEALHRLTEAYISLGIRGEALKSASVLGFNYPGSPWYEDTYKLMNDKSLPPLVEAQGQSIFGRAFRALF